MFYLLKVSEIESSCRLFSKFFRDPCHEKLHPSFFFLFAGDPKFPSFFKFVFFPCFWRFNFPIRNSSRNEYHLVLLPIGNYTSIDPKPSFSFSEITCAMNKRTSDQVSSNQVSSGQDKSGQVKSGQVRSNQVRSGQVKSAHVLPLGQCWAKNHEGQVRSSQVRSGQIRSGRVRSNQVKSN